MEPADQTFSDSPVLSDTNGGFASSISSGLEGHSDTIILAIVVTISAIAVYFMKN